MIDALCLCDSIGRRGRVVGDDLIDDGGGATAHSFGLLQSLRLPMHHTQVARSVGQRLWSCVSWLAAGGSASVARGCPIVELVDHLGDRLSFDILHRVEMDARSLQRNRRGRCLGVSRKPGRRASFLIAAAFFDRHRRKRPFSPGKRTNLFEWT